MKQPKKLTFEVMPDIVQFTLITIWLILIMWLFINIIKMGIRVANNL